MESVPSKCSSQRNSFIDYEANSSVSQTELKQGMCQQQKRLSDAEARQMRQRYERVATVYELSAAYGIDRRTVSERLKKTGIVMRGQSPSPKSIELMANLHATGLSFLEVGKQLGFCANTVRKCVIERRLLDSDR